MNPRFLLLVGLGVGYLLGARAGRERYEQIRAKATELWEDPRVRKARTEVEAYARKQAPVIRDRAGAAAKAAPGVVAEGAKAAAGVAKDVADKTADTAKDVAGKVSTTAKDVAGKVSTGARDVADKVGDAARDARVQVSKATSKATSKIKDRGEAAVDRAVISAGVARESALETVDDAEAPRSVPRL